MNQNPNTHADVSRRSFLTAGAALAAVATTTRSVAARETAPKVAFDYCFNTSTIRGQTLALDKTVEIVAKVGYQGIEPWIREISAYKESGGSLKDLKKRIKDLGLRVESAIGFANWVVDDPAERAKGLEQAKRDMDLLAQIGGLRIAAPPAGATNEAGLSLAAAAHRYHDLLEVGREMGVIPQLELWGFSKNLSRLGEVAYVAMESAHPDACILTDIYHVYKGGSDFSAYEFLAGDRLSAIHLNDYPAEPPRETIGDRDRVFPGDGIAPIASTLATMIRNGFSGPLSLELFNPKYWERDAENVAKEGLDKMRQVVAQIDLNAE